MKELNDVLTAIKTIFELVTNTSATATLSAVGLILLIIAIVLAYQTIKKKPEETPGLLRAALFVSLIGGMLFSAAGPGLALFWVSQSPIAKISASKAFDNLEKNERVHWLVRLIPFDPKKHPELAIGRLNRLGPPEQRYTFVAPYEELVGYNVDSAIQMTGGTYVSGQRVSAIIFPVAGHQIYPANARGLLQIIRKVEQISELKIEKPLLKGAQTLSADDMADLENVDALAYWRWENYKARFPRYCELAQKFRCNPSYSARRYIGGLNIDWHPLGLAQKDAGTDSCQIPPQTYCSISDWSAARGLLLKNFGSRAFLIENLELNEISNRVLIDFVNPPHQVIPDIGFRPQQR